MASIKNKEMSRLPIIEYLRIKPERLVAVPYSPKLRPILLTRSWVNLVLGRTLRCFPLNAVRTNRLILSFARRPKIPPLEQGGYSRKRNPAFQYKRKQKRKGKKPDLPAGKRVNFNLLVRGLCESIPIIWQLSYLHTSNERGRAWYTEIADNQYDR